MIKHYPKVYEDVYGTTPKSVRVSSIGATSGSSDILALKFKSFYKDAHKTIFGFVVRQVWLEQHFTYNGKRRNRRAGNGFTVDQAYGFFMKAVVGVSQKPVTSNPCFTAVSTYMKEFFPDFMNRDPFAEPEYYEYPYKHVTLDHLVFVHMMHNRLELLDEAEKKKMSFADFCNWVVNFAFCYNDDIGKNVYTLVNNGYFWPHLKNSTLRRQWANDTFKFDVSLSRK